MTVLVNPVIEILDADTVTAVEGCLSLPGMAGMVPRAKRIRYTALGLDGAEFSREAAGFHARVVQHECDHLDGVLYPMRMTDLTTFGYTEEMGRHESPLGQRVRGGETDDGEDHGEDDGED